MGLNRVRSRSALGVAECTDNGMTNACEFNGQTSIVRRDIDVSPEGTSPCVRNLCP